jgi:hypothetical protein
MRLKTSLRGTVDASIAAMSRAWPRCAQQGWAVSTLFAAAQAVSGAKVATTGDEPSELQRSSGRALWLGNDFVGALSQY